MAVYKVIQDIEAEDKLLGPLTLKGFIYALIAGTLAFINFRFLVATNLGPVRWIVMLLFLLPMLLFAVLASPLGREQPTEVWLLSHVRFLVKPRRRIWNQSGISQLVTITVPKRPERILTKGFSQTEVKSRLEALATTLDSHGWAVKNVDVNLSASPTYLQSTEGESDRLINTSSLPQIDQVADIHASDDIMDEKSNPTAQKFDKLIKEAETERKKGIFDRLKSVVDHDEKKKDEKPVKKTWALDDDTARQIKALHQRRYEKSHEDPELPTRLSKARHSFEQKHPHHEKEENSEPVTAARQADNMNLAQSGNAFSVATLQNLANRASKVTQISPNEVEISLH
jgi:hypothetical protein